MTATAQDRETARKLFDELFVIAAPVRIEHLAAALTAARREQAEADAKLLDGFGEQCRGYAMRSNVFASEQSWLAQARHHEADAAAIRARTTGGE